MNNVRREARGHFRNKKKAYLKAKIEELETNSKIKNIRDLYRGISDLKKGCQPRTNIVKDEKGDLVADSHSILARWRNYFSQLLHVHWVNGVRHTDIHTAEPLVPEPSAFEVGLVIEKLKSHKSPDPDPTQIFPFGAAFVCQAGNVWTLLRTSPALVAATSGCAHLCTGTTSDSSISFRLYVFDNHCNCVGFK